MRRVATAIMLVALVTGPAFADLETGKEKLLHGDYRAARAELGDVRGSERAEAQLLLARLELRTGDYRAAERRVRTAVRGRKVASDAAALLAEIHLATGRYEQAKKELEKARRKDSKHLRVRYVLALAHRALGERAEAAKVFESFFDGDLVERYSAGTLTADEAMYLGLAARHLSSYEDANDALREAITMKPELLEANLEWGALFLEKYASGNAEQSFDDVLKIDPNHPDAHAGMAQVKLEQSYDVAAARDHIGQALAVNPQHAGALKVRAQLEIDANDWDAARATLGEVLSVNPNDVEAHALKASIHWLRDERAEYDKARKAALAVDPTYAGFYHVVARSAVREHRYKEAIALEEQAVALDPSFHAAMQEIGSGYLRLGQEAKGVEWLQRAWEGDQYNVRTYNLLELYERVIPRDYVFATSKNFKIRYHKSDRKLLPRYLEPLLERAYAGMVKRYRFTPKRPTIIELYQNPEHYSVRTVGLPNLGALGVCFGNVITATSPSSGSANWGMVLWHELAHVFAIQMSKSRVPRWYTEGLSEYETIIARPEWRRENDADVWAALQAGALPSVAELNLGFMRPNLEEVVVAYHLSSIAIQFIAETWGFDRVVRGLELFGKGMETPEVIEKITGLDVPAFDAKFRVYLENRMAHYQSAFRLPTTGYDDLESLEKAATNAPRNADAQAALGVGYFFAGEADKSRAAMTQALRLEPKHHIALYVMGELALRNRDPDAAKKHYRALIEAGGDGFEPRGRLGMIAIDEGDLTEAEMQLARAKQLDPERSDPYILLAEAYEKAGRMDDALPEYEKYAAIEQMQYAPVKLLVDQYAKRKNWKKVREYGEMALHINPYDAEMLLTLGKAYHATGDPKKAVYSYDSALLADPPLRRPALAHVAKARAYMLLKDRRAAATALRKALSVEPDNREARALRKKLR